MAEEDTPRTDDATQQPAEEPDRMAQPVDAEQPPRLPFPVVGIGASAGGLEAVSQFLDAMRPDGGMAFVLVQHLPPDRPSQMVEILTRRTAMPVAQVEDGMAVEPDHVYVIRPGHVLTIRDGRLHLGPALDSPRAANRPVDDFFRSLAEEQRERAICVIMSGMGSNGTAGAQSVRAVGGLCIAQDPDTAQFPSMPKHLVDAGYADYVLAPADMPEVLLSYAEHPYARGGRESDPRPTLRRDGDHFREILSLLRTRTRHDFSGYKKPTLLRRIQRRMGLSRTVAVADYARLLRQMPAEVLALSDDLLIHVTGFFRDREAWDALLRDVVAPLVESRTPGGSVRAWVTACSSGEEAYSLAMVLVEEAERAGKELDIKVFATDLAERALAHARAGLYPGGIESDVDPERLERFFTRDDAVYRVREQLRECVVFAPQNVLQDPPFSRLDIVSCRNLMIYLEPQVQQRVLALLHFGLVEGGALFLGGAETVSGAEDLFEVIDKRARIFRRIGPTRHGLVDFPLPRALPPRGEGEGRPGARPVRAAGARPSVEQLTQRELLKGHTPAAVTVDREYRVHYYHGDTRPFLQQPQGEPTRDVMLLAREGVGAPVRVALHRAATQVERVTVLDGWAEVEPGRRARVAVVASPVWPDPGPDAKPGPPEFFVVSFEERGAYPAPAPEAGASGDVESTEELRGLRAELQRTVEEMQTSNEELRASNEEVMSINEEFQAANEELETSREEMQSLNEELTTVNSQLRAKMEEHLASSSDLSSLLSSTDIAVLFLDTAFRIRRYTPAVRDLVDLIATDVGRPLAALARRFTDPRLDEDARAVLDRLVPVDREVAAADGRHYLRRVLPYRTTDNRIDGVVVTFVDISARKGAEEAIRASEERFRRALEDAPIPVIMHAEDGQVLQVSRTWTELTGYTLADVPTLEAWLNRAYGPGADAIRTHMHELFRGDRKTLDVEFAIRTRGGAERQWSFSASAPGSLRDGRRFVVGMAVDVTERRLAAERLRESEERLRVALSAADMGTWLWRIPEDEQIVDAGLSKLMGLPEGEEVKSLDGFLRAVHAADRRRVRAEFERCRDEGGNFSVEFRTTWPDGGQHWLRDQGKAFPGPDGRPAFIAGACVDITARKQGEEALARDAQVLASVRDSVIVTDLEGVITHWNEGAARLFGWTAAEMLGRPYTDRFPEEARAWIAEQVRERAGGSEWAGEFEDWRKDGSRVWIDARVSRVLDAAGHPVAVLGVAHDLTERKRMEDDLRQARDGLERRVEERTAELVRSQERALQVERLATIGQTVTALAHEGRNALQRATASLARLGWRLEGRPEEQSLAGRTQSALDDLQRLFDDVRTYAAPIKLALAACDLAQVWREAWSQAAAQHPGRDARLDEEAGAPDLRCECDRFRLGQVFHNLFANALEACPDPVRVAVSCHETPLGGGPALRISVRDNGPGIPPEQRPRVFEAFFTTKPKGTGLGMAIVKRIVEAHGGTIVIEDSPGGGATIALTLPLERKRTPEP